MEVAKLFLPEVERAFESKSIADVNALLEALHPSDIAEILGQLDNEHILFFLESMPASQAAEILAQLETDQAAHILLELKRPTCITILHELSSDDITDMFKRLSEEQSERLMPLMAQVEREQIRKLLTYEEGTAGAVMTTEYVSMPSHFNAEQALQHVRRVAPERETIYYMSIIDEDRKLIGLLSLRDLIIAQPKQSIADIMEHKVVAMNVHDDQEAVAQTMRKYDFLVVPIVDDENRLMGIVTHDDILDIVEEEHTEDTQMMAAVTPMDEPYLNTGFLKQARSRGVWLVALFFAELLAAALLKKHELVLQQIVVLTAFIPIIISSGGNSGSQATTLITRGLALNEIHLSDWLKIVWKELLIGLVIGLGLAILGYARAITWNVEPIIGLAISLSIIGVVICGTLLGSLMPLFFKRIGIDPAIASSPAVASTVDIFGIFIYIYIVQLLIS